MIRCLLLLLATTTLLGCKETAPQQVIVYTALDEEFSKPIFDSFTRQTGIEVLAKFDTESTKTVGLVEAILAERERPRCDLFWNNELLHTLRLKKEGLLRNYPSQVGAAYPATARATDGSWHGFAARARVLIINTNLIHEARWPKSIHDLTDTQWGSRAGIAKPLFGTTATHAACLFAKWGEQEAQNFFLGLKRNARIMSGNKQVARAVAAGQLAFGLTDTDDAIVEIEAGHPVTIVYPDQGEDEVGTLFIPNSLALVKGSANSEAANKLVDFLLSSKIEDRLAMGPSAQIPLHPDSEVEVRVETPQTIRGMQIDFAEAAAVWGTASEFLRDQFTVAKPAN